MSHEEKRKLFEATFPDWNDVIFDERLGRYTNPVVAYAFVGFCEGYKAALNTALSECSSVAGIWADVKVTPPGVLEEDIADECAARIRKYI